MKNIFCCVLLMLVVTNANANNGVLEDSGLDDVGMAEVKQIIAERVAMQKRRVKKQNLIETVMVNGNKLNISDIDKYADAGTKAGKIVTGFLKEIGIAAENFLDSKWGILVAIFVFWHFFSGDIGLLMIANSILFIFLPMWLYIAKTMWYKPVQMEHNGKKVVKSIFDMKCNTKLYELMVIFLVGFVVLFVAVLIAI